MAYAPEHRVLLDNDASYYTAPPKRPSRSLTVARDLTLGFVAASALLLLFAKTPTGPRTLQVARNLNVLNVHGWLSDSIDVNTKLPKPVAVAEKDEEEKQHQTFAEKQSGVHGKFAEEVDTLLAADPEEAVADAAAKEVAEHDEWLSGDIDARAPPIAVVEPEEEEEEHDDDADEEHKKKEEGWLSADIDAHEPRAVVVDPEAEAHEETHDAHDDVHKSFTEHEHPSVDKQDVHPNVHESFTEEVKEGEEEAA